MTRKTDFLMEWSWFQFNNFGLVLGIDFYILQQYGKRKVVSFLGDVTREKLVGGWTFFAPSIYDSFVEYSFF